ncbi:tRNA 5-methoxyuridine(34)/uridine 5-oxyacetic acid(34) synthase CmoB [Helicobacter bilis]|uniref:tRNA 5-methoxyuridine(34)/uridine 5-oxyacetic acid(34) synthase CmoB n=1 Tax=Helicobacter bilis TaxID=37372 RepID=UPI00068CBBF0|nr:tRNA 5-methoxyuridine(34)/uridine 5-oxyacetic acid(34) synthase CmoB [Helicobacter bilis]MCI7411992.1 tRNA 5-methoxyuridine(34)/uridine 5-oxyacetic acid(34) synthase CmoB [Helicobacter bilis]MDY4398996.1 tRNA 5-methoxyuridine(34)/uridine 5-oxyacetic acid(34) synthase CmoB [Helicobacter bilis]TLE08479.1 tRNA 5-methoxyuridine(34)/uridine 5-oxyacetic acid(34) synthase CmoB [Helicobacter bilis]
MKKDLAAKDSSLKDLCKKDPILSTWSEKELNALKPYSEILYKLLTLETKATYSISRLCDNNSLLYDSSNNKILESSDCHVERSETSKILESYPNGWVQGIGTQNSENLETKTTCHIDLERSETSKNLESKNHNPNLTQILESTDLTKNTESKNPAKEALSLYFHNISYNEFQALQDLALDLKPWRKGPFCLYGAENNSQFYIDSEWQSNKKMKLILQALDTIGYNLKDKVVLDVGCNNGYYMFDLALRGVKHISGIDPIAIFFLQFYFIHKLTNISHCTFRLLGVQDVLQLNTKYDLILCLGVLYHRKEPLQTLKQLKSILAPNGILLLETLILQDKAATCLCPYPTYAKMPNVFYIFSPQALQNLALHAGFKSCEILSYSYTDNTEQRSTDFIDKKSLGDYLTPTQTIEGYPPACRGIFVLS